MAAGGYLPGGKEFSKAVAKNATPAVISALFIAGAFFVIRWTLHKLGYHREEKWV